MTRTLMRQRHIVIRAAVAAVVSLAVLGGAACQGRKEEKPTPTAEATPSGAAAAGTAQGVQGALKTDIQPLAVNVPMTPPKLDGLDVAMPAINTTIVSPTLPDLSVALPQVSFGSFVVPSVDTAVSISPPSFDSIMPSIPTIPTLPGGITIPPGMAIPPGGIPSGFPTPPAN